MTITTTTLLATHKAWSATLTIGTSTYVLTELPARTLGTHQQRGTCTCKTAVFPQGAAGDTAYVTLTLNGESERYFTGTLDVRPIADNPPTYEATLIDAQNDLELPLADELTWNDTPWPTAVRDLLHLAGITDEQIAGIYDPGSVFTLAPVYAITHEPGTRINELLNSLMAFAGAQLLVLANGQIQVVNAPGWPADSPTIVYANGANKALGEFGIIGSRRSLSGAEQRVARFKAYGPRRPDRKIPDATFTLHGVTGKTEEEEYAYIQTDACATAIAEREIVRRNRQSTEVEITAPLNPFLRPGDSLMFRNPVEGWAENTPAIVVSTSAHGHTMTMLISVGARPAAGDISHIPAPIAQCTLRYEHQPVSLVGVIAPSYVVEAINTSTDPSGFRITSVEWTATCAGNVKPDPESVRWSDGDDPANLTPVFVFPTTNGASITLSVESSSGEGAEKTFAVAPPPSELFTRTLAYAAPSGWHVLAGADGWRTFGENCTAVPGINDTGPLLGGFSDGTLYRTNDALETAPDLLYTFSGAVRSIFVNEGNPDHILVAVGATLYRSQDGGVSWTTVATFADDITYCESSPAQVNEIRVCAGPSLWISYDGATFTALLSGPTGSTCRKVASAPWGHLAVWSGTQDVAQAAAFEEQIPLNWTGVPPEHMPIDLAAVTPMVYESAFLIAAGAASDLVRDGLYQQLVYLAAIEGTTRFYKVSAHGDVTYLGTSLTGGPHKLVPTNKAFRIADEDSCLRIGYGQAVDPARPPTLLVLPDGATGAADALWLYEPEQNAWRAQALPVSGGRWRGVDIHPTRPNEWLIWTTQQIYWTGDAGATWIEIYLPPADGLTEKTIWTAAFTGQGSQWVLSASYVASYGVSRTTQGYLAFGSAGVNQYQKTTGETVVPPPAQGRLFVPFTFCRGVSGELFGHGTIYGAGFPAFNVEPTTADRQFWLDVSSQTITEVGTGPYWLQTFYQAPRAALGVWSTNIGVTTSYTQALPVPVLAAGTSVAACANGVFVGGRSGVMQIRNLETTPVLEAVAGQGIMMGPITAGSRRRGAGVMSTEGDAQGRRVIYAHNGVQWASVWTPDGAAPLANQIGVIEK